ncbi:MAG: integrase arm-type DNA-binding domain-containing protein [Bradyrhizobium sp.]|nr:integrase arm-type DNA-binding domain-containing protein [Bradyrhizobium sp.]
MARTVGKLTALKVTRLAEPGMHADGGGLYLQVTGVGAKSWIFRFSLHGKAREMGLGSLSATSLSDAREAAAACRRQRQVGIDPIEARKQQQAQARLDAAKSTTFEYCAGRYIAAHEASWRNSKHRAQWKSTLSTYVYPVFGSVPAGAVDTAHVTKVIEPLWSTKPETASRVRGRIESVLDWAKVNGFRQGENPARWKGHLEFVLPKRSKVKRVRHHPALPYDEVPAFTAELREREGQSARALEFLLLTAARTEAVIGALLSEVDFDERVWTVPPDRAGTKMMEEDPKPRRVPLSDRAIKLLKSLPREDGNPYLFIGGNVGRPLSNMAMLELMREMRPGFVPHGLRSTFKDWCAETTNYPNEVSEAALWHAVADKVEAAYRRGDLFEKRRRLMAEWAKYCTGQGAAKRGAVVQIRAAG